MLTLGAVRPQLWKYASGVAYSSATADDKAAFDSVLNQVCDRFLKAGYSDTLTAALTVYADRNGNPIVTLPRELNTVIGGKDCCGTGLVVRGDWYEFLPNGPGSAWNTNGIIAMPGRFTTYRDWDGPFRLRVKMEKPEEARFLFRGKLQGDKIFTDDGGDWIEGAVLNYVDATATTTQLFDEPPYLVIKPVTEGRVTLWIVDADDNETQVAVYEPDETVPKYQRYKVPCMTAIELLEEGGSTLPSAPATQADITALFGGGTTITISAAGTHDLAPNRAFGQWFQRIIAQAGSGPYTHNFTLDNAYAREGAIFRIAVEVAASANPTILIYNESTGGTLLDTITGDSSNAGTYFMELYFNGTEWARINGNWLLS